MKTSAFGVSGLLILVITILIVANICNTKNRDVNLKDNVRETLETSLKSTLEQKNYTIANEAEFISDLSTTMSSYLAEGTTLDIDVTNVDDKEGFVSLLATVNYSLDSANKSSKIDSKVSVLKTVYLEKEDINLVEDIIKANTFTINYSIPDVYTGNAPLPYKIYKLTTEDTEIRLAPAPIIEGYTFGGWKDVATGKVYSEAGLKALPLTKSYDFVAVVNPL